MLARTENTKAIVVMMAAVGVLSLMDAGLKLLAAHYPPLQVATLRGAASVPFVLLWILPQLRSGGLLRIRWHLHLARGAATVTMLGCFVFALQSMSLATAYTVFFIAPPLVAALSVPLLDERVSPPRWIAIFVGLAGVLVVLRPSGDALFTAAGLAMLAAAASYALSSIAVRILARTDSTHAMVFWTLTMLTTGAGVLAWPGWVPIHAEHLPIIAAVGVLGALGQYALTFAFSRGEASVVAAFEYTAVAWGVGLDLALWSTFPDVATWVGAAIIIGSGLALLRQDTPRGRAIAAEAERPQALRSRPPT